MTAAEVAGLLKAKRAGRGWIAKCVAHSDRNPSLSIWEGRKGVMLKCMSQGCSTKDICAALGITVESLFYDSGNTSPEIKERLAAEGKLAKLQEQYPNLLWLADLERKRRSYWEAAARRVMAEMEPLYWAVEPDKERFEKVRRFELNDYRAKRLDWLRTREVLDRGGHDDGVHRAGVSPGPVASEVRPERVHQTPQELQARRS